MPKTTQDAIDPTSHRVFPLSTHPSRRKLSQSQLPIDSQSYSTPWILYLQQLNQVRYSPCASVSVTESVHDRLSWSCSSFDNGGRTFGYSYHLWMWEAFWLHWTKETEIDCGKYLGTKKDEWTLPTNFIIFSRIWCLVVAKVLLCYECAMRCFEDYPRRKTLSFVDVFLCSLPIHFLCMNVLVCVSAFHPILIIYSYLDLIRCQSSWWLQYWTSPLRRWRRCWCWRHVDWYAINNLYRVYTNQYHRWSKDILQAILVHAKVLFQSTYHIPWQQFWRVTKGNELHCWKRTFINNNVPIGSQCYPWQVQADFQFRTSCVWWRQRNREISVEQEEEERRCWNGGQGSSWRDAQGDQSTISISTITQ